MVPENLCKIETAKTTTTTTISKTTIKTTATATKIENIVVKR